MHRRSQSFAVLTSVGSAVGGTIVCTLLGAVLFARGVAQVPFL